MTVSLWQRAAVREVEHADCIVIGGGICGLSAALHLERRGLKVLVLERTVIGGGASSRNAGFLMRGAAENYAAGIRTYGRDLARLIWKWSEENLAGLREEGVADVAGYQARPSCLLALEAKEAADLEASVSLLREDGFRVAWALEGDDAAWRRLRPLCGLINPDDGVCHPLNLLRHLAAKLEQPVHEQREVFGLEGDRDSVRVLTGHGAYRAGHILVCTNAYAPLLLSELQNCITARRGQVIAVRCPGERLDCAYYANEGYEYFRMVEPDLAIFGGCRRRYASTEVGYDDCTTTGVQGGLEEFAARTLGVSLPSLDVTARWSGTMGFSPDGLPLVGAIAGPWLTGRVFICGGFTGHGMSLAYRVSRSAVELMLDGTPTPLPLERVNRQFSAVQSQAAV